MQDSGMSRGDYERLPTEVKLKSKAAFEGLKQELRYRGFSLRFLGLNGRWKDLTAPVFLALPQSHYERLITGSKWVRPRPREDLLEQISELYDLARQSPKLEDRTLDFWSKETSLS